MQSIFIQYKARIAGLLIFSMLGLIVLSILYSARGTHYTQNRAKAGLEESLVIHKAPINLDLTNMAHEGVGTIPVIVGSPTQEAIAMVDSNEAQVPVRTNIPASPLENHASERLEGGTYLRLGVFSTESNANRLLQMVQKDFDYPAHRRALRSNNRELFQVLVGPVDSSRLEQMRQQLDFKYEIKSGVVQLAE